MKNNNFISFVTAIVIGLIIGGGVIGLIWHNSLKTAKKQGSAAIKEITVKEKQIYLDEYKKTGARPFWSLTKVSVYRQQYDAMTYLLKKNPALTGFRFYPGIIGDPIEAIVVCATDPKGNDDTATPPILTFVEPCPPNCDQSVIKPVY